MTGVIAPMAARIPWRSIRGPRNETTVLRFFRSMRLAIRVFSVYIVTSWLPRVSGLFVPAPVRADVTSKIAGRGLRSLVGRSSR